jgi:hypothetical protein
MRTGFSCGVQPLPLVTRGHFVSIRIAIVGLACLILGGCSSSKEPKIAPVDGVVMFKGRPVQHAHLTFLPVNGSSGSNCAGQTDVDGRFTKVVTASSGKEGAVVGSYTVTVTEGWPPGAPIPVDDLGQEKSPPREKWPQKYRDSASGALKVDVSADKPNHFEFDLSK